MTVTLPSLGRTKPICGLSVASEVRTVTSTMFSAGRGSDGQYWVCPPASVATSSGEPMPTVARLKPAGVPKYRAPSGAHAGRCPGATMRTCPPSIGMTRMSPPWAKATSRLLGDMVGETTASVPRIARASGSSHLLTHRRADAWLLGPR